MFLCTFSVLWISHFNEENAFKHNFRVSKDSKDKMNVTLMNEVSVTLENDRSRYFE